MCFGGDIRVFILAGKGRKVRDITISVSDDVYYALQAYALYFADCKQNMTYVKNYLKDLKVKGFAGKKR